MSDTHPADLALDGSGDKERALALQIQIRDHDVREAERRWTEHVLACANTTCLDCGRVVDATGSPADALCGGCMQLRSGDPRLLTVESQMVWDAVNAADDLADEDGQGVGQDLVEQACRLAKVAEVGIPLFPDQVDLIIADMTDTLTLMRTALNSYLIRHGKADAGTAALAAMVTAGAELQAITLGVPIDERMDSDVPV